MILVTGASKGIGWGICQALLQDGQKVIGTFSSTKVENLPKSDNLKWKYLNFQQKNSVERLLEELVADGIKVNYLVNNAGVAQKKYLLDLTEEDWSVIFEINFFGPVKLLVNLTKSGNLKRAVNITSVSATTGGTQQPHYAASKAALLNYTKSFANFSNEHGVIVNAVAPGLINTEMLSNLNDETELSEAISLIPVRRIGTPTDVANVVKHLLLDNSGYINGQTITINGGKHV